MPKKPTETPVKSTETTRTGETTKQYILRLTAFIKYQEAVKKKMQEK